MQLPKITLRQEEILDLLYKYRYLNRIQIQTLMQHKDRKTINLWLRDLREKEYVGWIYSDHFAEKTKPAIYYLSINGVRWLKQFTILDDDDNDAYLYPIEEIRKRYRDNDRSEAFVTRCTLTAQCAIDFTAKNCPELRYSCYTQTDFIDPDHTFHFLTGGDLHSQLGPQLHIRKHKGKVITNYLLEIFDPNLPRYRMSKRLKQYVTFLTEGDWEAERGDDPLPIVLLVCAKTSDLIYAKRKTRGLRSDLWDDEEQAKVQMRFTTVQILKQKGATAVIWEEA